MIRNYLSRILTNLPGWRSNRKILVIESDDWGSIRMPSKETYKKCLKANYPVDKNEFERYDSLLSQDDLELFFDLLTGFKDMNGNNPIITANCVVANPDFERIRKNKFEIYYYELITDTFRRYPQHANNFCIWQQAIKNKVFKPQFHAREHLNVSLFMNALRSGDKDVHFGFDNMMPGSIKEGLGWKGNYYIEATNYSSPEDKKQKLDIYLDGLEIFERLFGYRSETIIPPNYTWSADFDRPVLERGVKVFQGLRKIREPQFKNQYKYKSVYIGKRNSLGQTYLVRNTIFEPSLYRLHIKDPVARCLRDISIAFMMGKPAIICSHRINYVGFIDKRNRDNNLGMLKQILSKSLAQYPDIEFMSSDQLAKGFN